MRVFSQGGLFTRRQNGRSRQQGERAVRVQIETAERAVNMAFPGFLSAFGAMVGFLGRKLTIDGDKVCGVSTRDGAPLSAILHRGGQQVKHDQLLLWAAEFVKYEREKRDRERSRIVRLDADLRKMVAK